ncbi:MAG: hypothetical protein IPJ76_00460 [Flavobacteriales bacterium]|nr:MAG: hypothetical protein IPJ76_00460 [Flavobacteriales bacterium]
MSNKATIRFFAVSMLVMVPLAIWQQRRSIRLGKEHFAAFNAAELNDTIVRVRTAHKGCGLMVRHDPVEYVFYPSTDLGNKRGIFDHIAKPGDVVRKGAYSDTLMLFKKDRMYQFTFWKPN